LGQVDEVHALVRWLLLLLLLLVLLSSLGQVDEGDVR